MKDALSVWCVLLCFFVRCLVLGEDATGIVGDNTTEKPPEGAESIENIINELEPSREIIGSFTEKLEENEEVFSKVVVEAAQNSGLANDIPITSGQPVVVTLSDVAATELDQRAPTPIPSLNPPPSPPTTNHTTPIIDLFTNHTLPDAPTPARETPTKENLTEEIPSFSEWTQKQLQEDQQQRNTSTQQPTSNGNKQAKIWKNYASPDCGAKIVATNPEATNPSGILSPSMGEYNMNTCTEKIWFIVELCEAIQAKKIHLANAELFSSSPKEFVVSVSDRFPTRDWINVGQFEAEDNREVQSFDLNPHLFGKYIKVEIKSHYGSQYYCVVSLFRVFGTSEFEVLQKEEHNSEDEDDETDDTPSSPQDTAKNVFTSATDVVMSMVKKAAEVLGKGNRTNHTDYGKQVPSLAVRLCTSPARIVVCDACGEELFAQIYELLSCQHEDIRSLTNLPFLNKVLLNSDICQEFGFDFNKDSSAVHLARDYVKALLPVKFLGAMCNMVAILKNKAVLNVSDSFDNSTTNPDLGSGILETSVNDIGTMVTEVTEKIESNEVSHHSCSTDITYTSQIKPTKTLDLEVSVSDVVVEVPETVISVGTEGSGGEVNGSESVELDEEVETLSDEKEEGVANTTPQPQKESVFLRLSNRIKALERNMSLSGQYLEELSKRYKKQVEEIQKLLEKTLQAVQEESTKKDERNRQLEEKLLQLTANVDALMAEKNSWSTTLTCVIFSSLVTMILVTFCCRIPEPASTRRTDLKRRKSIDAAPPQPQKKKRRPSDQAMKIVRSSTETAESSRRRRRKRALLLKRSNSIGSVWTGGGANEVMRVQDVPIPLEESEHTSLEPMSLVESKEEVKQNGSVASVEVKEKDRKKTLKRFLKKVF